MIKPKILPFKLMICGLHELQMALARFRPTHVVSIGDPDDEPQMFPESISVLYLNFFDADSDHEIRDRLPRPGDVPSARHAKAILEFGRQIPASSRLLLHCWAGVSRSTASAILLVAQALPGNEDMAIEIVRAVRPQLCPNRRLVEVGDRLLGLNGRLVQSLDH